MRNKGTWNGEKIKEKKESERSQFSDEEKQKERFQPRERQNERRKN